MTSAVPDPKSAHRVVIVGAGFGGLECALRLKGAPVKITLVDRRNRWLSQRQHGGAREPKCRSHCRLPPRFLVGLCRSPTPAPLAEASQPPDGFLCSKWLARSKREPTVRS